MGRTTRFLAVLCLVACAALLEGLAAVLRGVALVLKLLFVILCIAALSHLAYGTATAAECGIGLLLFAGVAALIHLLAFTMGRAARAFRYSVAPATEPRGFEVRLAVPRPVLPAEQPPP